MRCANVLYDVKVSFILYDAIFGIKVVHIASSRVARVLGFREAAVRFVCAAITSGVIDNDDPDDMKNARA